ncbi:MAG TPA: PRC-barrel domain-containing protein [Micropepsaceae bacterium]|nr:PRC-barrel domain-containing protein [Micropepsaceae bacterium]
MATAYSDTNREVPRDETFSLIASDKVEGTAVYGPDREKIGSIDNVMIEKRSGRVAYAVLSFGGFLGMGTDHYPLPWSMLKYDEDLGGYVTNITSDQLKGAPKYSDDDNWDWNNQEYIGQVDTHYRPAAFI